MKVSKLVFMGIATSLVLFGCASNNVEASKAPVRDSATSYVSTPNSGIPDWFLNPPTAEDAKYATGQATKNLAAAAQKSADVRAMQAISEGLQSFVKSYVKDYFSEVGVGDETEITALISNSVKVISKSELVGARVDKRAVVGNTWYTLMIYPNEQAVKLITKTVESEMKKEEAIYNRFRAKQTFNEMEDEIDKAYNSGN